MATNAARYRMVAGKHIKLLEFGLRRAQGPDGGLSASKYSYIGKSLFFIINVRSDDKLQQTAPHNCLKFFLILCQTTLSPNHIYHSITNYAFMERSLFNVNSTT